MMEAVSTSETSVNFYLITRRNIPEDSHIQHVSWLKVWSVCQNWLVRYSIAWLMYSHFWLILSWSVDVLLWYTLLLPHSLNVIKENR
jgi:hypothetical protein